MQDSPRTICLGSRDTLPSLACVHCSASLFRLASYGTTTSTIVAPFIVAPSPQFLIRSGYSSAVRCNFCPRWPPGTKGLWFAASSPRNRPAIDSECRTIRSSQDGPPRIPALEPAGAHFAPASRSTPFLYRHRWRFAARRCSKRCGKRDICGAALAKQVSRA